MYYAIPLDELQFSERRKSLIDDLSDVAEDQLTRLLARRERVNVTPRRAHVLAAYPSAFADAAQATGYFLSAHKQWNGSHIYMAKVVHRKIVTTPFGSEPSARRIYRQ